MRPVLLNLGRCAALLIGAGLVTTAQGQAPPPPPKDSAVRPAVDDRGAAGVHKLEILSGASREVRYFGGSPGERVTLNDLERAENELGYVMNVEALKRQYVNSERILEPQRRYVQEQLYGTVISYGWNSTVGGYGYGYGRFGGAYNYIYPYNYGGYGYPGVDAYMGSMGVQFTRSLAIGMGDEGKFKDAMVQVIAQNAANPDYVTAAYRNYTAALNAAASNKELARSLRLGPPAEGVPVGIPAKGSGPATVTLKSGEKLEAANIREDGEWYVVELKGGGEVRVRKAEVKVERPKP
jgi:hypothetical protein